METAFTRHTGVEVPLICGAMYPCSNPELVAAVSAAGGMGVVQPISLSYVHGHDLREGLRLARGRGSSEAEDCWPAVVVMVTKQTFPHHGKVLSEGAIRPAELRPLIH